MQTNNNKLIWVQFMDMHSGGGAKEPPYEYIYIQAESEDQACKIFYSRFGHNPQRVSCTCCGEDYNISSEPTLKQVTAYNRGCDFDENLNAYVDKPSETKGYSKHYQTLEQYKLMPDRLFISFDQVKASDYIDVELPEQGYVWKD